MKPDVLLLLSLQVKRTTRPWCGSGSTRGSPSAARPAEPTTSWWPTSCPTNLYHTNVSTYTSIITHVNVNVHFLIIPDDVGTTPKEDLIFLSYLWVVVPTHNVYQLSNLICCVFVFASHKLFVFLKTSGHNSILCRPPLCRSLHCHVLYNLNSWSNCA